MHHNTKVETIAKFAPLTATKWVKPERFITSLNSGVCFEVSPKTIPGIKAPASPSPELVRNPSRIAPKAKAQPVGLVKTLISPLTMTSAATLASLLLIAVTTAEIFCPGSNSMPFLVTTRMGVLTEKLLPAALKVRSRAVKE